MQSLAPRPREVDASPQQRRQDLPADDGLVDNGLHLVGGRATVPQA